MKKLLTFFMTALLAIGVGWAEEMTFTVNTYKTGTLAGAPSGVTAAVTTDATQMGNGGSQLTSAKPNYTLTLSGFTSNYKLTGIKLNYCTNSKTGQGTFTASLGSNPIGSYTIAKVSSGGTTARDAVMDINEVSFDGTDLVLSVHATENSVYVIKFTVTYEENGSTPPAEPNWYRKVTSANDLVAGKSYIIVNEENAVGMGELDTSRRGVSITGLTFDNNRVNIGGTEVMEMTLGGNASAYTFQVPNGKYLSDDDASNYVFFLAGSVASSATDMTKWTITFSSGVCSIRSNYASAQYVRYNASTGYFGTFASNSQSAVALYMKVEGTTEAPTFSPDGGTFYGSQTVTISSATTGATIYYTTDGSTPTTNSSSIASGGTVTIDSNCTLKAIAVAPGYDASEVAEASYTKETLPMPTFSPVGGTYDIGTTVTVEINAVDGASIYYTLDGSTPVANRAAYSDPITISENTTLKAIAVLNGETSEVATAEYIFAAASPTCPATIDFDNTSTTTIPGTGYRVSAGSDFVTGSSSSTTYEEADGIRVGSGSSTGSLTLTLASDYNKVKKVVVNIKRYSSDEGVVANVSTNNGETKSADIANQSSFAEYVFDNFSGTPVTTLTISNSASKKRFYIDYITIYYECAPIATLTVEPNPLNINDDNSANGKTGTFSVNGSNLGTDNVGVTVNGSHSANFTTSPGYFSHDGTLTDQQASVTYTGHALSATGLIDVANDQTSTSVNVNYLYTGPIYVVGNVNDKNWQTVDGVAMTRDEATGTYSVMVNAYNDGNGYAYLYFTKSLSASSYDALGDNRFGPVSNGNWELNNEYEDHRGEYCDIDTMAQLHTIQMTPGAYTITINPATNQFKIDPYVITVTINPEDGSTFTGSTVSGTITDSPAGTIEWSTDGQNWQQYDGGFTATAANVGDQVTIYARSTSNGVTSEVVTATYQRIAAPAPAAPTFSRGSGAVSKGTVITITAPAGTTLYVNGEAVTSPHDVTINSGTTISAYCVNDEGTPSETVTNTYTIASVCEAVVEFDDNGTDAQALVTSNSIQDYYIAGANYISSVSSSITRVYKGETGLKFGSNNGGGSLTFNLNNSVIDWKVSHITLNAKNYNGNNVTFTVTTSDGQSKTTSAVGNDFGGYTLDFNGDEITSITISSDGRAYLKGFTLVYNCAPEVEVPVITPATGTYYEDQTVAITAGEGATIHYTTDGSEPTTASAVYDGPFTAAHTAGSSTTIKAIAVDGEGYVSEVATATYTWATPSVTIVPDSRNVTATSVTVTLTATPAEAAIYYTTDGSEPTEASTRYSEAFAADLPNIGDQTTVKAIAIYNGLASEVATATYTRVEKVIDVNAPFFSPLAGQTYYGDQTLKIGCTTPNADIYYIIEEHDIDGNPTKSSTYYDGSEISMTVGHTYHVKAIAYIGNFASTVSEGTYTIVSTDEFEGASGVTYVANIAEFNALGETTATIGFMNPVQVVFMSTYENDGSTAEFCYIRDNSDYGCVYFGKNNTTYSRRIFEMGDWIDGTQVRGLVNVWENNFHNQMGSSNHYAIKYWPSSTLGWSEIIPETTTTTSIASGTADGDNLWGHYVHLRYTSVTDVALNDSKYKGSIQDPSGANTYYDKFYRWSGLNHSLGDYDQSFFDAKAAAGATFDVYGIVDYYKPDAKPFQVCPIDFLWAYKPVITPGSNDQCTSQQEVNITVTTPEWATTAPTIYYKTDDMEEWAVYNGTILVNSDTHIDAYAELPAEKSDGTNYNDYVRSETVSADYKFIGIDDPAITPASKVIEIVTGNEKEVVTIWANNEDHLNVITVYTTDGSMPVPGSENTIAAGGSISIDVTETTTVTAASYLPDAEGNPVLWSNVVSETYTFVKKNGVEYKLVKTAPQVGHVYVIVNKDAYMGMSTVQNEQNRGSVGVMFKDAEKDTVYGNDELAQFVLESANAGRYYFKNINGNGYLVVTTNANANLNTSEVATSYSEAAVTIGDQAAGHPATIMFNYDGTNRYMRYFAKGRTFSTYSDASLNEDVFLYGLEATPLAYIESSVEQGKLVTVSDQLIGAWAIDNPMTGEKLLWAKDQGNASIDKRPAKTDGQRDYVKDILKYPRILDGEKQQTWDESNWVILDFSGLNNADPFEFVGHKIESASITGIYSDSKNYRIDLEQRPVQVNKNAVVKDVPEYEGYNGPFPESKLGTKYDLAYNSYVPANFMTENHNRLEDGKVSGGFVADETALPGLAGDSLYFVNPKIQEVAHIWAVWTGGDEDMFTVYQAEHKENENVNAWNLNGTFLVDWTYNCTGNDADQNNVLVYGRPKNLVTDMAYEFHAVIQRRATRLTVDPQGTANAGTPSPSYMLYPLDMSDSGTPTAVLEVSAVKAVVGVSYYNLMGQESKRPFEGINIEVTRYSDGTTSARKLMR